MKKFSPKQRTLLTIFIAVTIVTRLALSVRSEEKLFSRPYLEDSYYVFSCAWHLAHGEGFTVDGIHLTNGVQPLVAVLEAPFFLIAGSDKILGLRLTFILIALSEACAVYLIARLLLELEKETEADTDFAAWRSPPIIAAGFWTFLYPLTWHNINGLETGLYAVLLLANTLTYLRFRRKRREGNEPPLLHWMGFGVLLGFTVLARIDAVFFVIAFAASELFSTTEHRWRNIFSITVTAFIISSPWWLYSYFTFGSLMPVSGQSESIGESMAENLIRGAMVIADMMSTFFYTPYYDLPATLYPIWIVGVTSVVYAVARRIHASAVLRERYDLAPLIPLAIGSIALAFYYILFFNAPHFLSRYLHPLRIVWIILFAASVPFIYRSFKASYAEYPSTVILFLIPVTLGIAFFNVDRYVNNFTSTKVSELYRTGKWATKVNGRVGMSQSGTAGFVAPNVVNLDGKVNPEALHARQDRRMGVYLEKLQLNYIADWKEFSEPLVRMASYRGLNYVLVDSIGRVMIYQRLP